MSDTSQAVLSAGLPATKREITAIVLRVLGVASGCSLLAMLVALLTGCVGLTPDTIVASAPKETPSTPAVSMARNGAIYDAGNFRPMFEDRRARLVGDTLIVSISEKTSAGKNVASSASKDGKVDVRIPSAIASVDMEGSLGTSYADKAAANAANNFTGTVTVTVTEALPNGNLRVRGEKQVAFDRGTEFIRFSGLVNPINISAANTVPSTAVAEMRVEYRTNSSFDRSALQSALARFFFSVLPL